MWSGIILALRNSDGTTPVRMEILMIIVKYGAQTGAIDLTILLLKVSSPDEDLVSRLVRIPKTSLTSQG